MRVEHEYARCGAWASLAALDGRVGRNCQGLSPQSLDFVDRFFDQLEPPARWNYTMPRERETFTSIAEVA